MRLVWWGKERKKETEVERKRSELLGYPLGMKQRVRVSDVVTEINRKYRPFS
jgi:hypothetical protein